MNDEASRADTKRRWKKTIFAMLLGAGFGFVSALVFMRLIDNGTLGDLETSREIAGLVGLVFLLTGVGIGIALIMPKAGATYLNVEDADEVREQRGMLTYSSIGMAAMGAILVIAALAAPVGPIAQGTALALIVALLVVVVGTSIAAYRRQDELMRAVGNEAGKVAFYILSLAVGGWAIAAHLGYAAGPAALDLVTLIFSSLLIAAFYVTARRGMMVMR